MLEGSSVSSNLVSYLSGETRDYNIIDTVAMIGKILNPNIDGETGYVPHYHYFCATDYQKCIIMKRWMASSYV